MEPNTQRIVVVDLRIPYFRLAFFLVKLVLATIPASIILFVIFFVLSALAQVLLGENAVWMDYWRQ